MKPTVVTWILVLFGLALILLPMIYAQGLMLTQPESRKTRDILIGEGEDWRDKTHFRTATGYAWADYIVWFPLLLAGSIGVLRRKRWGYALWLASGSISIYINIVLWFSEREYVLPSQGPLIYYSYYWGFFIYWGIAAVVYSIFRLTKRRALYR